MGHYRAVDCYQAVNHYEIVDYYPIVDCCRVVSYCRVVDRYPTSMHYVVLPAPRGGSQRGWCVCIYILEGADVDAPAGAAPAH